MTDKNNQMLKCPHCGTLVEHGLTVCRGCKAEIEYGTTFVDSINAGIGCGVAVIVIAVLFQLDFELVFSIIWIPFAIGFIGNLVLNKDNIRFKR